MPSETNVELMPIIAPLDIISLELPANSSGVAWKHASALNYVVRLATYYLPRTFYSGYATYFLLRLYDYTYYVAWKHASVSLACSGHSRYW